MPGNDLNRLKRLPRKPREVWQGGLVRMPSWVTEPGLAPVRPWGGVWKGVGSGLIHVGTVVPPSERSPDQALEASVQFALDPTTGGYLPGRVEVAGPGVAAALEPILAPLGVAVIEGKRLAALDLYRKGGNSAERLRALRRALKANRHVRGILLGRLPSSPEPSSYSPGSIEEARHAAVYIGGAWKNTPGALAWLERVKVPG